MLEQLCQDIKNWLEQGIHTPKISINFSRKNLGNPVFAKQIYKTIKKYDIPLELIEIEITETVDEFPYSYLEGVVEKLHEYGISVAIDDFGTGSSSIRLLCDMNFDVLKIDKSFIENIAESKYENELLKYIIAMAKLFQVKIVAEGVEQKEQSRRSSLLYFRHWDATRFRDICLIGHCQEQNSKHGCDAVAIMPLFEVKLRVARLGDVAELTAIKYGKKCDSKKKLSISSGIVEENSLAFAQKRWHN